MNTPRPESSYPRRARPTDATYEVVAGNRSNPGAVLATFRGEYKCGGAATACLRWFDRYTRRTGAEAFFRKVA